MRQNFKDLTIIVLAGGKSTRMKAEKPLVLFRKKPLIEHVLQAITPLTNNIIISSNSEKLQYLKYKIIPDEIPGCGPLGGIYTCQKTIKSKLYLVVPCDTPFINAEFLSYIIQSSIEHDITVPINYQGYYEPLLGCYNKGSMPYIQDFIKNKNYKIPQLFQICNFNAVKITAEMTFATPNLFDNINTLEDLENIASQ